MFWPFVNPGDIENFSKGIKKKKILFFFYFITIYYNIVRKKCRVTFNRDNL